MTTQGCSFSQHLPCTLDYITFQLTSRALNVVFVCTMVPADTFLDACQLFRKWEGQDGAFAQWSY